jgi:hypothetical protein
MVTTTSSQWTFQLAKEMVKLLGGCVAEHPVVIPCHVMPQDKSTKGANKQERHRSLYHLHQHQLLYKRLTTNNWVMSIVPSPVLVVAQTRLAVMVQVLECAIKKFFLIHVNLTLHDVAICNVLTIPIVVRATTRVAQEVFVKMESVWLKSSLNMPCADQQSVTAMYQNIALVIARIALPTNKKIRDMFAESMKTCVM